jgi:hypothetical protein
MTAALSHFTGEGLLRRVDGVGSSDVFEGAGGLDRVNETHEAIEEHHDRPEKAQDDKLDSTASLKEALPNAMFASEGGPTASGFCAIAARCGAVLHQDPAGDGAVQVSDQAGGASPGTVVRVRQ